MSSQYPLIGGASATIVAYQLNKQLNLVKLIERETLPTGMGLNIHLLSKAFILIHKYENTPGNLLTDTILSSFLDSFEQGLQAIRCPAGLYFDIEKQTCDWKDAVKNCKNKNRERKVKPLLITDEPLCQDGFLACGDGNCIERGLFCNGEKDCTDGSDENSCGKCCCAII